MLVRTQQHDTLDLLCWRHLGATVGVVEAALELNRNQCNEATLPHSQLVKLPDPPLQTTPTADMIHLWD
jgi:phage tail protein X